MKACALFVLLLVLAAGGVSARAEYSVQPDSLGLPGDNLNLFAVLKLFQESPTLEEFEQKLNEEESRINNLDLDGDDRIDYIRVVDNADGNLHAIVLQVPVTKDEAQDVAVIQVERDENNRVTIQVIGDEDLYGRDYIIEPRYDSTGEGTPNPGYTGSTSDDDLSMDGEPIAVTRTTTEEVAGWPVVRFIFLPTYDPWYSPWYYGYYPPWWRAWSPFYWHYYWGFHYHHYHYYYGHYHHWHHYRNPWVRTRYHGVIRSSSSLMRDRRTRGAYRATYSRPELRRDGIELYRKTNPADVRPATGRPGAVRPSAKPASQNRPGTPSAKPRTGGKQKRPAVSKPGTTRPGKPSVRPGTGSKQERPSGVKPCGSRQRTEQPKGGTRKSGGRTPAR